MGKLSREIRSFSGGLVGLAIMLIALFFLLNFIASRGWGPFSSAAGAISSRASGDYYSGSVPVVGVPSSGSYGPNL